MDEAIHKVPNLLSNRYTYLSFFLSLVIGGGGVTRQRTETCKGGSKNRPYWAYFMDDHYDIQISWDRYSLQKGSMTNKYIFIEIIIWVPFAGSLKRQRSWMITKLYCYIQATKSTRLLNYLALDLKEKDPPLQSLDY